MAIYYGDANGKAQEVLVVGKPGPQGPAGPQGAPGPQGPAGQGVPAGGTAGQVLTKTANGTAWGNATVVYSQIADEYSFKVYSNGKLLIFMAEFNNMSVNLDDGNGGLGRYGEYGILNTITLPANFRPTADQEFAVPVMGVNFIGRIYSKVKTDGKVEVGLAATSSATTAVISYRGIIGLFYIV